MGKIKILYLIDKLGLAGAQKHLSEVISGLDKRKYKVRLVTLNEIGVKRIYGLSGIKGLFRLIGIIKQEKVDIVHTYLFSENILGVIAAKIARVKYIITSRRDTGMLREGKWQHISAYRITNRCVDKVICVSEAVKKVVLAKEKVNPDKVHVIYNGIDANKFTYNPQPTTYDLKLSLEIKDDDYVVGMIANFSWIKGHKEFVEAAKLVLNRIPNTKFLLIGDGVQKRKIETNVENLGLKDKILFLGKRGDIPELLSIMDVSVNASYSEGMSNTILESMVAGVPVVATAVDGNLETVINEETGILIPPGNSKAMAEAIIKILKDKKLAKKMKENSIKTAKEKFDSRIMVSNFEKIYEKLLNPKIAFIFSQFPCYDETFILREMNQLMADGLDFVIYSIKQCKDNIIHDDAKELIKSTRYLPLFSVRVLMINLLFLIRRPLKYVGTFSRVFFSNIKSPKFFLKTMGLWFQAVGFAWMARKEKITQVHGQWATYPTTFAFIISRLNNIPFSFTGHAHDIYLDTTMLAEKMDKATFVATCTADNKRHLIEIARGCNVTTSPSYKLKEKIIVNYHGVELDRFKKINEKTDEKFNILSVGSLLDCKGFDILIDACKILKDKGVNFTCIIAGGGQLEKDLKNKVTNLNLSDYVKFTGYITQDKLIPYYQNADVFALPVRLDMHWGIPNVLLEAMVAKTPVITTALPSVTELIEDGKTGFIIPEKDANSLAEKLMQLAKDPGLRSQIGEAGYRVIREKFDMRKNASNLIELFDRDIDKAVLKPKYQIFLRSFLSSLIYLKKIFIPEKGIPILMYHKINNNTGQSNLVTSVEMFEKQMQYLHKKGYRVISIDKMNRELKPRGKGVVLTFDDGWEDNYTNAFPILKKYGFSATVFLTAGRVGKKDYLTSLQIKEMSEHGIDFGAHTLNHPILTEISPEKARAEINTSKVITSSLAGKRVESFCYPKGRYDENIKKMVQDSGFDYAFTIKPGKNTKESNPLELTRTEISGYDTMFDFKKKLAGAYDWLHELIQAKQDKIAKRQINILYVIWSLGLGGAERTVINLVKGLDKTKYNPIVCCLNWPGEFAPELESEGIKVIALNKRPGFDITVIKKLITVIKQNKIDIVHTHLWTANFWGRIAAKLAGVPVIIASEHGISEKRSRMRFIADKVLSIFSDKVLMVSENVRKQFAGKVSFNTKKVEVIYNGIELNRSQCHNVSAKRSEASPKGTRSQVKTEFGIKEKDFVISCIGRLSEEKGHKYLLEAIKNVNGNTQNRKVLIVGSGKEEDNLRKLKEDLQLDGNVIFTGFRKDVPDILAISDLLVIPSLREAHSIVALEAMASGVPVISTDVGGMNEIILNNKTGLLVPKANNAKLAEAIERLIENKTLRKEFAEAGKKRVKSLFDVKKMVKNTEDLYEELYKRRTGKHA